MFFAIGRYSSYRFQVRDRSVTGAGIFGEASGDNLTSLVIYAIPASTYRRTKKDFPELGRVAQWEGAEVGCVTIDASAGRRNHSATGASIGDLVEKFHQDALKKKKSDNALAQTRSAQSNPDSSPPAGAEKGQPASSTPERDSARKPPVDVSQYAAAIKIETSLVVVPVNALDRDGKYIPDLVRSDFHIYELFFDYGRL